MNDQVQLTRGMLVEAFPLRIVLYGETCSSAAGLFLSEVFYDHGKGHRRI